MVLRLKLFPKIAIVLIFLSTLPAFIVGWQTVNLNKNHLETNILELHTNLVNSLADKIDINLNGYAGKARAAIETLRLQGAVTPGPLQALIDTNSEFISIAFLNTSGKEILKAVSSFYPDEKTLRDYSQDPFYLDYASHRDPVAQARYRFDIRGGKPLFLMIFPADPARAERGAFFAAVSLSNFWTDLAVEGAGVQGIDRKAFVVDDVGTIIIHSDPQKMLQRVSAKDHPLVTEALQNRSIGSREFSGAEGDILVGAYARVKSTGWVCVIEQPKQSAYYAVYETRKRANAILWLTLLASGLISFFLAKDLLKPIFALISGAQKVAKGDFSHSVKVDTEDEMSDLAGTFNDMVKSLRQYSDLQIDRLISEKTKTEAIVFSIADGIILTDNAGKIQLVNEKAAMILSLCGEKPEPSTDPRPWLGKSLFDSIGKSSVQAVIREVFDLQQVNVAKDLSFTAPEVRHFQATAEPVFRPGSAKKIGVVIAFHEVTLEREMDKLKETFLQSITHDLRNPLSSIMGFVKFIRDGVGGPVTDQQGKMLDTVQRAGGRLMSMVNDILDIAKFEAGQLEPRMEPVNVASQVEEIAALYESLARRKNISLDLIFPLGVDKATLSVKADASMIERVISNLAANALKFSPHDSSVRITVENLPDRVQISVEDHGPGIPDNYKEKIFDKFQQLATPSDTGKGGTGLGLTICRYFVELHHGQIWVESKLNEGSKFIFWIPKEPAASKESASVKPDQAAAKPAGPGKPS